MRGSVALPVVSQDVGRADIRVAPWELLGARYYGAIGVLEGRPIADDRPRVVER